ncbi:MAG: sulfatase [Cyclobacteriaceae bacterium]|nr:sulfatase [Cyclobacteriaceae bacterium]
MKIAERLRTAELLKKSFYIWVLLSMLLPSCGKEQKNEQINKPNIVIIFTDDQGYQDVGCFGSPNILTPNLDRMANEGVKFDQFYVAQAVCSASRAALMTGCYPNRVGINGALSHTSKIALHTDEMTLAEVAKSAGYATGIFGKWHLGHEPDYLPVNQGFDEYYGIPYSNDMWPFHPERPGAFPPLPVFENGQVIDTLHGDQSMFTTILTEKAVNFINRNKNNPFFLYVPHPQPHVPLFVSDKFKGKSERGLYGDVIMEIDWSVGEILKAIKNNGLDENTLVIFTSDNGPWLSYSGHSGSAEPLREGKGTSWEGGIRVPCIMRWPGTLPEGKVQQQPAMTIDLLPTIAGLIGAALPERKIDGKDIFPLMKVQEGAIHPHDAYFIYYNQNELQSIISKEGWKLYFPHTYRSLAPGQAYRDDGIPNKYHMLPLEEMELYNLYSDISEESNVAAQHPEVVARLARLADAMRLELGDALNGIQGNSNREPGRQNVGK